MFPRAALPERIGPYRVVRRLPSAGGVDQYLGREEGPLGFSREVLLKLAPSNAEDPALADELSREAAAVARLNHPGVVRMLSFFQHEDRLVLVMERIEGASLGRVLQTQRRRKQPLPDQVAFYVAHRLVSAVAAAHAMTDDLGHRQPIVHRAIHPGVVICGWDGTVRLSGFGLAKIVGRTPDTAVGMVKGMPGYMAPEQLRGERVTERADVYQVGLVIWEMLAGEPPPSAQTDDPQMMMQRLEGTRMTPVAELRPSVPREVAAVIDAALEPNVDKRTITAAEIERWLSRTTDVEGGKEPLRERVVALRSATARAETPQESSRASVPPRSVRPRRTGPDRFPSQAVRGTGRPSEIPENEPPPPSRRVSAAPRSARPAAPISRRPSPSLGVPRAPSMPSMQGIEAEGPAPRMPNPRGVRSLPPEPPPASLPPAGPWGPPIASPRTTRPPPPEIGTTPTPTATHEPWITVGGETERALDPLALARPRSRGKAATLAVGLGVGAVAMAFAMIAFLSLRQSPGAPAIAASESAPAPIVPTTASVAPATSAPASPTAAPATSALTLAPGYGALLVHGVNGTVFVNGVAAGPVDHAIALPCGRRYVRVGTKLSPERQTTWLSKGVATAIVCGTTTEVSVLPMGSDGP